MRSSSGRIGSIALLVGRSLVLVLIAVSCRSAYAPRAVVHKSEESKRPKFPKKVMRVEEFRVATEERQHQTPRLPSPETAAQDLEREIARRSVAPALPAAAFLQLTRPDYLQCFGPTCLLLSHAPPT